MSFSERIHTVTNQDKSLQGGQSLEAVKALSDEVRSYLNYRAESVEKVEGYLEACVTFLMLGLVELYELPPSVQGLIHYGHVLGSESRDGEIAQKDAELNRLGQLLWNDTKPLKHGRTYAERLRLLGDEQGAQKVETDMNNLKFKVREHGI